MDLWEFLAARDGVLISKGAKPKGRDVTDAEFEAFGLEIVT